MTGSDVAATALNPKATDHLAWFITAPGQSDGLMAAMAILLVVLVFGAGLLYLHLHALPEHLASNTRKLQMDLVAVLAILALFTHQNLFWVAALMLAMVELPDYTTPLTSIARSMDRLAAKADPPAPQADADPAATEPAAQEG